MTVRLDKMRTTANECLRLLATLFLPYNELCKKLNSFRSSYQSINQSNLFFAKQLFIPINRRKGSYLINMLSLHYNRKLKVHVKFAGSRARFFGIANKEQTLIA